MRSAMAQTGEGRRTGQSSPEFLSVSPDKLDLVWHALAPLFARGLQRAGSDPHSVHGMYDRVKSGDLLCWVCEVDGEYLAGVLVSVRDRGGRQQVWVDALGGVGHEIWGDELIRVLDGYRRATGSDCVGATCRPGMARLLAGKGWRQRSAIMEMK